MTTLDCEAALSISLLAKANGSEHPSKINPYEHYICQHSRHGISQGINIV